MIIDMSTELRDFTYITSVYKCIATYNLKGHQIGRKIGDMLEILTMGGVYQCPQLVDKLDTEGKLEGYTTAGHKVEFGFYENPEIKSNLFGAIECKCVGVEETTDGKGTSFLRKLEIGQSFELRFSPRWLQSATTQKIELVSFVDDTATITLSDNKDDLTFQLNIKVGENIKFIIDEEGNLLHTSANGNMLMEIPGIIRHCKTIKFDKIDNNICQFSLYNCLTGPQTIEKAKQASLVAMDLRKKIDGFWGKEEISEQNKKMSFIHVLCEYSHWEEKSRNVISTCIDHNLVVPDSIIIKAFETFETKFGTAHMLDMISKRQYLLNLDVKLAVSEVLEHFENHIFFDVTQNTFVKFNYLNKKLVVENI